MQSLFVAILFEIESAKFNYLLFITRLIIFR